ncbi:putative deferrochelatase/peroxidase YfeX [Corynebacterium atrinae]|uniref:Dyp-type peroxidase n=1 Tax=Corynebacterium atrinae TaxID=1336740 RepID=UPI0025B503F7|nr:Dyp-type peroxidase [Corynebacterium atrinae]WJY62755.1 putative deferrochelatase/peroxidase YfeX [Corynebacterium atrinae]
MTTTSQPVVVPPASSAIVLVLSLKEGSEATVRTLLADVPGLIRSVAFRAKEDRLTAVVGIGSNAWDKLFDGPRPAHLHPFRAVQGAIHQAPSTPGDLVFHIRAQRFDLCFELARQFMARLDGSVTVEDETHTFKYFDERDLLGFVDGTENPEGLAAIDAVTIDSSDPDFTGGSYLIVQKYLHDLTSWNHETVEEQEKVIGRTKLDDIELPDDIKPSNSHVAANTITDDDGNDLQIVRENMIFGEVTAEEFGTYFIGYAKDPAITEKMLDNMFIGSPPGNHDRILDFSTATTGTLFFIPTIEFLEDCDS